MTARQTRAAQSTASKTRRRSESVTPSREVSDAYIEAVDRAGSNNEDFVQLLKRKN